MKKGYFAFQNNGRFIQAIEHKPGQGKCYSYSHIFRALMKAESSELFDINLKKIYLRSKKQHIYSYLNCIFIQIYPVLLDQSYSSSVSHNSSVIMASRQRSTPETNFLKENKCVKDINVFKVGCGCLQAMYRNTMA